MFSETIKPRTPDTAQNVPELLDALLGALRDNVKRLEPQGVQRGIARDAVHLLARMAENSASFHEAERQREGLHAVLGPAGAVVVE